MSIKKQLSIITRTMKEMDDIYHQIAMHYGLSDCAFWMLYILYSEEQEYSQKRFCEDWSYSKQTVNSTVSKLCKERITELEGIQGTRNRKNIKLTGAGKALAEKIVRDVNRIDYASFSRLTEEERELYVKLSQLHLQYTEEEFRKAFPDKP